MAIDNLNVMGNTNSEPSNVVVVNQSFKEITKGVVAGSSNWNVAFEHDVCDKLAPDRILVAGDTTNDNDKGLLGRIVDFKQEGNCIVTLSKASLAEAVQDGNLIVAARMVITSADVNLQDLRSKNIASLQPRLVKVAAGSANGATQQALMLPAILMSGDLDTNTNFIYKEK